MKKILSFVLSLLLILPALAACGKTDDLRVSIKDIGGVEVGTECVVPEATVISSVPYSKKCKITDPAGYSVIVGSANTFFVAMGGEYTVEYTVTTAAEKKIVSSKIATVDIENPVFKNPVTSLRFVKGAEITVPDLKITDKGGAIKPQFDVTDNEGNSYPVTPDYKFTANATAHTYKIKVTATDKGGNTAEKLIYGYARGSEYEIEGFNEADFNGEYVLDGSNGTVMGIVDFEGAEGKVLKFKTAPKVAAGEADWDAYYNLKIKTHGITDLSESEGIVLRVYNDGPELKVANALTMNAQGDFWGDPSYNKILKANSWNEIIWTKSQLDTLLNGETYDAYLGRKITRSTVDNVTQLAFHIDNSGWWGTSEGIASGGHTDYANQEFTLYFDSIKMIPIDKDWSPAVYETDEATVYEINSFDGAGRIQKIDWMDTDMSKVDFSSDTFVKENDGQASAGSMKVTFTHAANFYPNMVMKIDKLKETLGKKLSELPDEAAFIMDVYHTTDSGRDGAYEGGGFFRFYKEGSNNDGLSKLSGEYGWCEKGEWTTFTITVAQAKAELAAKKADITIDMIDRIGFFFYMDAQWAGGSSTTFIFDNWRLVVPKI